MIMFSNRTVQIEESEESVRLRSVWDPQRVTSSARRMQAVKICELYGRDSRRKIGFFAISSAVVSISNFSKTPFNLFFLRLSSDYHASEDVKQEKGKAVDLGGDGKFTPHAETTLDAEPRHFRQDFGIPDEIELVLRLRERTRSMFVRGFAAPTSYWRSAGMIFPVPRFLMEALAH
ncbi:unnamed protein product [Microthlaspi erraticum]|uniref:Uncharacterized protein n=1 Tax=Microthlaspi erraticum TaxID=1685480 RepID=A0A6D2JCN7_9BRAS|nr:unnamed protein product [Microthlaspi erraticum]